jgi:D-glycero-D-manno-heptose 1,7-bisphosphate phosphatase
MKLAILDRDGVINADSLQHVKTPAEWKLLPGSGEAVARLNQAGFTVVVATNQSGIGRGLFDMDMLNAIHEKMRKELAPFGARVDSIFFCPHTPDARCTCRKPKPGMFLDIASRYDIGLAGVPAVGDALRDLEAAAAAGCQPILVLTGKGRQTQEAGGLPPGTQSFADLAEAAAAIIEKDKQNPTQKAAEAA